jgi:hypothetical protein
MDANDPTHTGQKRGHSFVGGSEDRPQLNALPTSSETHIFLSLTAWLMMIPQPILCREHPQPLVFLVKVGAF